MPAVRLKVDAAARKKLDLALAFGLGELALATVHAAEPRKPRKSEVATVVMLDGQVVGGTGQAPKDAAMRGPVAYAMWGFPARFAELGTAAHDIHPKRKHALAFGGLLRGAVHHPGSKGRPFINPALISVAGHSEASLRIGVARRWAS